MFSSFINKCTEVLQFIEERVKPVGKSLIVYDWFKEKLTGSDEVYVKDLREVIIDSSGKSFKYPKEYDKVVQDGNIIKEENNYVLIYNGNDKYYLSKIPEIEEMDGYKNKGVLYFTIDKFPENPGREYYEPFGFLKQDTQKYLPVFECIKLQSGELKLSNSSDIGISRNGEPLYRSYDKKSRISFFEIRDSNNRVEWAKSLFISVPVIFITTTAKIAANVLTLFPIELGKYLMNKGHILELCGRAMFGAGALVKHLVNLASLAIRVVVIGMCTGNKEKYADKYWMKLTYQCSRCYSELTNDLYVIFKRDCMKQEESIDSGEDRLRIGTWDELNTMRDLEKKNEKNKESNSESVSLSCDQETDLDKGLGNYKSANSSFLEREQLKKVEKGRNHKGLL